MNASNANQKGSDERNDRELTAAVAANLLRLRTNVGLDLAALADLTGLSVEQLAALETGRTAPNLRTLWALADAFEVPFGVLLSGAPCAATSFHVARAADSRVVVSAGAGFRSRALSAAGDPRQPEVYEVTLSPGWREDAAAHAADTFEHIVVVRGTLVMRAGEFEATLAAGDAVFFRADRPHVYRNPDVNDTLFHLTMTYAGDWIDEMPS
jgi:transcriptional regulator with XRE-family HTH domain